MRATDRLFVSAALAAVISAAPFIRCSKDTPTSPPSSTLLKGAVKKSADSTAIGSANVVVYDANTNAPLARALSSPNGAFSIGVAPGVYYLRVAAQGYLADPAPLAKPVSFQLAARTSVERTVYLASDPQTASTGSVSGRIEAAGAQGIGDVLIVALRTSDSLTISATSGPDGFFVLCNMPAGVYSLRCLKAGLQQDSGAISETVASGEAIPNVAIRMSAAALGVLRGSIKFLAAANGRIDVTLVHPVSREAIPALCTFNDSGLTFELRGIPSGDYIVWGSYRNDGYVMDPDWIRKNGLPHVSFSAADTVQTISISVTDTIAIVSPTNPPDSVYPVIVTTTTPTFKWAKYPSAKEYIIEVVDRHGAVVWGGFDAQGVILHRQIDAHTDSIVYNFDGSALAPLKNGETYHWKVYADNAADPNVQGLISSSEDLRGLFMVDTLAGR